MTAIQYAAVLIIQTRAVFTLTVYKTKLRKPARVNRYGCRILSDDQIFHRQRLEAESLATCIRQ